MQFKPDIDFGPLIADGVMSREALTVVFGRPPQDGDIKWCFESFRSKHPELGSLIRSYAGRLFLMGQRQGRAYRRGRLGGAITAINTAIDHLQHVPVDQLTPEERREHSAECSAVVQLRITQNPLRKALPSGKER